MKVLERAPTQTETRRLSSPEVFSSQEIKDFLTDMIRADHPQWVADDGSTCESTQEGPKEQAGSCSTNSCSQFYNGQLLFAQPNSFF